MLANPWLCLLLQLQETVKRKLESAGSPLGREQSNGYGDSCFPPSKKACLENGAANGSPLDSKLGLVEALGINGTHEAAAANDGGGRDLLDFHRKEMKQEPDDILPIMPPSGGGASSLFPDLNLNEQEWTELMEELNCSVPYEDIQDILNDGFEDRKDPLEQLAAPAVVGGAAAGGGGAGGAALLPPDLVSVKSEFSPASVAAFEQQDSRAAGSSPHVRATPTGPAPHTPLPTSSPAAASSASSPAAAAAPAAGPPAPPRQLHLLPPKDLSPAQQLQQLAAQQQRAQQQHLHSQLQHKQQQQAAGGAKFHSQGPHPHPHPHSAAWPPMAASSQSPLGGAFGLDKPSSPSLYPQDFTAGGQKQLLMSSKASPKAGGVGGVGPYLAPPPAPHHAMLAHPHPAQASAAMLSYSNTKPLSHFEAGPGGVGAGPGGLGAGPGPPTRTPGTQVPQKKAALLSLLRQQQVNQKNSSSSIVFRQQHLPHSQVSPGWPAER